MKSRRTFIKATVLSAALASMGVVSFSAHAADTIKVGVLHSLSGTMAISETAIQDGRRFSVHFSQYCKIVATFLQYVAIWSP